MTNKKYKVFVRVEKEFVRIITAKNANAAIAEAKRKIAANPIKISTRNFEKFPNADEIY